MPTVIEGVAQGSEFEANLWEKNNCGIGVLCNELTSIIV